MIIVPVPTKFIADKTADSETSKGKGSMVEEEHVEDHTKNITFEEGQ